jgi:jouberin
LNKKHPNALAFDENGRLFVGDSFGQINVWQVSIDLGRVQVREDSHVLIKHKEIEGDQINEIIIPEDRKNLLYVHSRDNCIRLIEYETSRGTRVKKRFFGSKC